MAERGVAACAACEWETSDPARPAAPRPVARVARRVAGIAAVATLVAAASWLAAPVWMPRLPHLPERLPVAWQTALAHHPLLASASLPPTSPEAIGPVLQAATARGELVVAVRHYRRPTVVGAQAPLEPDRFDAEMADFVATRLGLPLRLVMAGAGEAVADLTIAGAPSVSEGAQARIPTAYTGGNGALVVLRGGPVAHAADLHGARICVPAGSPHARTLAERHGAVVRSYGAAVQAVAAFMAGECHGLADDELTIARLMRTPEWRFYRRLDIGLPPDNDTAQIALRAADARSLAWLDKAVRQWKANGALLQARQHRAANVGFEASQLQDGLVCHS
ncbi:transporter substrate-binding domain-containing protein [Cupriavidus respiraculi]|uniref:Solute-binding protein family 3/N-terminal domain-containing protein n=1 Tax=Cupriavidus respiraculi TaxID=195930 RepID=A0ABM8WK14_9BURK|nr:transporter substrate-binding domain-containing protein [Cupriavidus respiraculi]CAG9167727.1 hypothetical protein LMG21510_00834 [Cupriavidus respiraculi]